MRIRLPKRRLFRIPIYIVSVLLILLAIDLVWVRLWRRIRVGPDTTRITAPLRPDGMPDYFQYVDDRAREGITAENNAAIPFLQAITLLRNPHDPQSPVNPEYYVRLKLDPPTAPRQIQRFYDFLPTMTPSVKVTDQRYVEARFVSAHPWSAAEHPEVVAWLKAQEEPLNFLPAITSRPRWYLPLFSPHDDLMSAVYAPHILPLRDLANCALARAMLAIQEKRFAAAQVDILACHRLARLSCQGNTLIEYLMGSFIENQALPADLALASAPGLPPEQLRQFRAEIDLLPSWPRTVGSIHEPSRFRCLETLIWVSRHLGEVPDAFDVRGSFERLFFNLDSSLHPANFAAAMRQVNDYYDRLEEALNAATVLERARKEARFEADFEAMRAQWTSPLADPALKMLAVWLPNFSNLSARNDDHLITMDLTRVALALIQCRADSGSYPDKLDVLAPKYLNAVPVDPYSEQPLRYQPTADGFMLYSIGPNGKDDGGKSGRGGDDIVVKIPL